MYSSQNPFASPGPMMNPLHINAANQGYAPPWSPQYGNDVRQQNNGYHCIPVASVDEAKNHPINAFGIYIFPSIKEGKVYMKQIGNDGTALFQEYSSAVTPPTSTNNGIPEERLLEFQQLVAMKISELENKVNELLLSERNETNESVSNNASDKNVKESNSFFGKSGKQQSGNSKSNAND